MASSVQDEVQERAKWPEMGYELDKPDKKQAVNFKFCVIVYYKNELQGIDMFERIVRQLAQANKNLTGN